jgi:hypothetical protein
LGHTHELALLTSTLGQEKIADSLLTGLAKGFPLDELIERVSLKKAKGSSPCPSLQEVANNG